MEKTYQFESKNGLFICFNDFQSENSFNEFKNFICKKLATKETSVEYAPYSVIAETNYKGHSITLMFHEDTGCCIRLDKGKNMLANDILGVCFTEQPA
jgi:hypothetical protein